ncbi:MAG: pilus assembly protein [Syntrophales bacterium]
MKSLKSLVFINIYVLLCLFALTGKAIAVAPVAGEEALFTNSTQPDALIVLDLSGSMEWNPAGGDNVYGNTSCSGTTFYSSSGTGHTTNCSRLNIAKRAIFDILDDNDDNTINSTDETSLGVRVGYMRFYDCSSDDTGDNYTSGCIQIPGSSSSRRYIGSKYSQIYCNSSTSCTVSSTGSYSVGGASATGGTPLASSLREAKTYLDAHKLADTAAACRKKFVILITDGSDTFACSGSGAECDGGRYKGRRDFVARAKALADAGYKVFVVGFGSSMPDYLENTLNWTAYHGGTDNPNQANAGSTSGFTPGVAGACTAAGDEATATCTDSAGSHSTSQFKANTNDPGYASLSGYAFLAADADQLAESLKTAMNIIRQANYSFSQASVQSSRTSDENNLYEGSFEPGDNEPFWKGHLRKYEIDSAGAVAASATWDAGTLLENKDHATRNIKTCGSGSLIDFTTAIITPANVGITTTAERDAIVGFIRGNPTYNLEQTNSKVWKLGDVFRSTPITVGTPSAFFSDARDANSEFNNHRDNHPRTSANGLRLVVAGANDGQMHAFKTVDGSEAWSFIPPNLLTKLKNMTHSTHPTALTHQYFVDGPVTVADVWLGSGDGKAKAANSWKTIMVFGLGRGAVNYSWSSSSSCDSGINPTYSASFPYYCGYHALDLDNSLSPAYLWRLAPSASQAPYLGDSWGKMMTGRVLTKVGGTEVEKWVGFIGAGYNAGDCAGGGSCDPRGKGFYVVDLSDGTILWSFTNGSSTTSTTSTAMNYSIPGPPAILDTDNDGFVDLAYIGDIGGKMWRIKFCTSADVASASGCGTSNWSGAMFFDSPSGNIRPIYTSPATSKDTSGNLWVYWGTGDKTDPTASNAQEHFYGVKDNAPRTATYTGNDVDNITQASQTYDTASTTRVGWRIQLAGGGQKILADPTVFGGVVYYTSYTPPTGNDPCEQGGTSQLNGVNFTTGGGAITPTDGTAAVRSIDVGSGIASAPVISLKPGMSAATAAAVAAAAAVISSGGTAAAAAAAAVSAATAGGASASAAAAVGETISAAATTAIASGVGATAAAAAVTNAISSNSAIPDLYVTPSGAGGSSARTMRVDIVPPGVSNRTNMLFWRDRRIQ